MSPCQCVCDTPSALQLLGGIALCRHYTLIVIEHSRGLEARRGSLQEENSFLFRAYQEGQGSQEQQLIGKESESHWLSAPFSPILQHGLLRSLLGELLVAQ